MLRSDGVDDGDAIARQHKTAGGIVQLGIDQQLAADTGQTETMLAKVDALLASVGSDRILSATV